MAQNIGADGEIIRRQIDKSNTSKLSREISCESGISQSVISITNQYPVVITHISRMEYQ